MEIDFALIGSLHRKIRIQATDSLCNSMNTVSRAASFFMSVARNHHPSFMLEINKTFFSIILQACFVYSQPASMFAVQADLWLIFYDVRW